MEPPIRDSVFLIHQFLEEIKFNESVRELEQESGFFFNLKYFEEKVLLGEWDEVEKYLSAFTKFDDNENSNKIFFEIKKQKYLEALYIPDYEKAVEILRNELRVFEKSNKELYKELTQLLGNLRENLQLSNYGGTKSARCQLIRVLTILIKENPLLGEKLTLPAFKTSRLRTLINQSLSSLLYDPANEIMVVEVIDPTQCRQVTIPNSKDSVSKVGRLLYSSSGAEVLALGTNGVQRVWKWSRSQENPTGKVSASVPPHHWQPNTGLLMTNDVPENHEGTVPCIALSKNDHFAVSSCGGKVSLFNMKTFELMATFKPPPPASTFLAFHPQDDNIMAIGMDDSTILIYNAKLDEVKATLKGHKKHITGLAFSAALDTLVSSGADAQLLFWSTDSWEITKSLAIQLPDGKSLIGDTQVQFHEDQLQLLVSHETYIAIYDCSKMEYIKKLRPNSSSITCASYSCKSQFVYASFKDGNIGVFDAEDLRLRRRVAPSAYLPQSKPDSPQVIPLVITAHPQETNQIAVGLSDGTIKVIEIPEALPDGTLKIKQGRKRPSSSD